MKAADVKRRLYSWHYAAAGQMPGAWTVIEEWRGIDVLAFSAWWSADRYARVGYEVKVSRSDYRRELLSPHKRAGNVAWCNAFYFAVPHGLLTDDEIAYVEPEWQPEDWIGEPCPGYAGVRCMPWGRSKHSVEVPVPTTASWGRTTHIVCPTCKGKGEVAPSRVVREAPTLWVPRDVGLVVVGSRGAKVVKPSPRRATVPTLDARELGLLVRWVSMRPDPRHVTASVEAAA